MGGRVPILVHLDENERGGIFFVLQHVESSDPRLLGGLPSVLKRRFPEGVFGSGLGFDEHVNWTKISGCSRGRDAEESSSSERLVVLRSALSREELAQNSRRTTKVLCGRHCPRELVARKAASQGSEERRAWDAIIVGDESDTE
jgi:hypothetical protein